MNSQSFSWFYLFHLLLTIKFLILIQTHKGSGNPENFYQTCGNTFRCDAITRIGYPFRGLSDPPYCGHPGLVLTCDEQKNVTTIDIMNSKYRVLEIFQATQTMRIVRNDVAEGICPQEMVNTTLDYSLFDFAATYTNLTFLYGCPGLNIPGLTLVSCGNAGYKGVYLFPGSQGPGNCNASVIVPVLVAGNGTGGSGNSTQLALGQVLQQGFEVRWKIGSEACTDCTGSKGRCGFNFETNRTSCFCPDPPFVSDICPMDSGASPANGPSSGMYDDSCASLLAFIKSGVHERFQSPKLGPLLGIELY